MDQGRSEKGSKNSVKWATLSSNASRNSGLKNILDQMTHGGTSKELNARGFVKRVGGGDVATGKYTVTFDKIPHTSSN